MAFANGTIWHIWSDGGAAAANGGGFDPTNPNFAADLTTDASTGNTSSPVVSTPSYTFTSSDVGFWVFIQGGTDWIPGWYPIASVTAGKATLSAAVGEAVLYGLNSLKLNYRRPNGRNTVAGVATVGTPTGGVWGIDYAQRGALFGLYTDMVIGNPNTLTYTSAAKPVGKNLVGNTISVTTGTGFTVQRVQVVSTSGTVATVDKTLGTAGSTGGTGRIGGAAGDPVTLSPLAIPFVAGNKIYMKGAFTIVSPVTPTASVKGDLTNGRISVEGFSVYPGDLGTRPILTTTTNSVALINLNDNDYWEFINLDFFHNAATRGVGIQGVTTPSLPVWIRDCVFDGCSVAINAGALLSVIVEGGEIAYSTNSTGAVITGSTGTFLGIYFHDNNGDHIRGVAGTTGTIIVEDCLFALALGYGINDVTSNSNTVIVVRRCTFVDNGNSGIRIVAKAAGTCTLEIDGNLFYGNVNYQVEQGDTQSETDAVCRLNCNNYYETNQVKRLGLSAGYKDVIYTGDPFVDRAGGDYRLNNTPGAGALVRASGFPSGYPGGAVNYLDGGAIQHEPTLTAVAPLFIRRGGTLMKM